MQLHPPSGTDLSTFLVRLCSARQFPGLPLGIHHTVVLRTCGCPEDILDGAELFILKYPWGEFVFERGLGLQVATIFPKRGGATSAPKPIGSIVLGAPSLPDVLSSLRQSRTPHACHLFAPSRTTLCLIVNQHVYFEFAPRETTVGAGSGDASSARWQLTEITVRKTPWEQWWLPDAPRRGCAASFLVGG